MSIVIKRTLPEKNMLVREERETNFKVNRPRFSKVTKISKPSITKKRDKDCS